MYIAFLRPHIDYDDIIYDKPSNESFCEKLKSVQYKAALAMAGAIQRTSKEKNLIELDLESIKSRRLFRRLCFMFKIMKNRTPEYLKNLILEQKENFNSKNIYIPSYNCRTKYSKSSFFPNLT